MEKLKQMLAAAAAVFTASGEAASAQEPSQAPQQERRLPDHLIIPRGIDAPVPQERIEPEILQRQPLDAADVPEIPIGEPREREYMDIDDLGLSRSVPLPEGLNVNVDVGIVETPSGAADEDAVAGIRIERRNDPD